MRENMGLFRGKHPNGMWVYGSLAVFRNIKNEPYTAIIPVEDGENQIRKLTRVDPDTVGECTGLADKNGKLIFEGDIVKHYDSNPCCEQNEIGRVFWDETYCSWRRTSNGAFHNGKIDTYRMSRACVYEIRGNIQDNPELMKGAGGNANN